MVYPIGENFSAAICQNGQQPEGLLLILLTNFEKNCADMNNYPTYSFLVF
jgi:hypothetical protein